MKTIKIGEFSVHSVTKTSVQVGCTEVTKAQIQRLLKLMENSPKNKIPVGSKVKVVREVGDSRCVLGLTGKVVKSGSDLTGPLVSFPGFTKGHGEDSNNWYVKHEALRIVR